MKLLEIVHPAAKSLVDVSLSQDAEVRGHPDMHGSKLCLSCCSPTQAPCSLVHLA